MITERKKIEYVTRVVSNSGGFKAVFLGLVVVVFAFLSYAAKLDAQTRNHYGKDLTLSLGFLIIITLFSIFAVPKIQGYLRQKYGQVRKENTGWREVLSDLLYLTPYFLAQLIGIWTDVRSPLPFVSVTVLLAAVFVFGLWFANQRGISNFLLYLAGAFFVLSFAPWEKVYALVTVLDDEMAKTAFYYFICSMAFGIIYFLFGLSDYRLMTATLKPVAGGEEGEIYESV